MTPRTHPSPALRRRTVTVALPLLLGALAPGLLATPASAAGTTAALPGLERTSLASASTASPHLAVAQARLSTAQRRYDEARAKVARVSEQSARLRELATVAEERASELRAEVDHEDGGTLLQVLAGLVGDGESDLDRAAQAAEDAAHARELAQMAGQALTTAITDTERARAEWDAARREVQQVESRWTARQAADAAIRRSRFTSRYDVDDARQDARNRDALAAWHSYLEDLVEVGVAPPRAERLADPDRLPRGLDRVRDDRGGVVPGVAEVDLPRRAAVTVIPAETVQAVSEAFRRVGLPDVPGAIAPSAYACGGLLANAWGPTTFTLPADSVAQWEELRSVPRSALQVGDAVVLGSRAAGLEQSGVYVGGNRVIVADPETGTAGVQVLPREGVFGVKRVPLPTGRTYAAPAAGACGVEAVLDGSRADGSPLVLPVAAGAYTLSSTFGDTGPLWSSGVHTGLDFAAPVGTPVVAMADGVVSTERPEWAGNLVRIDHGGGAESSYAHLDRMVVRPGQQVRAGQVVGTVGNEGNSTGPHLHLEVRLDGDPVDPAQVLDVPGLPRPAYANGEAPLDVLCSATAGGVQLLRCDAAVTYRMMGAAFEAAFDAPLCVTDSYRSRDGQVALLGAKPGLAAEPGTSVHGWGLAVDLCGGVERFGTAEHTWVKVNGPAFGWEHPSWAAAGGTRPEPWHFEFAS